MNLYNIKFRSEQGVLLRILAAVTRRGLDLSYVYAARGLCSLRLEVSDKQDGQLQRDWNAIVGVEDVTKLLL